MRQPHPSARAYHTRSRAGGTVAYLAGEEATAAHLAEALRTTPKETPEEVNAPRPRDDPTRGEVRAQSASSTAPTSTAKPASSADVARSPRRKTPCST